MPEYIERERYCDYLKSLAGGFIAEPDDWTDGWRSGVVDAEEIAANFPATKVTGMPLWISVEDELPEAETEVLAVCNRNGFRFVCPVVYEDGAVLTQDSIWNWYDLGNYGTFSEENDDYFIPEGWWENRQFTPDDVYNSPVDCSVTHWMPLPAQPNNIEED